MKTETEQAISSARRANVAELLNVDLASVYQTNPDLVELVRQVQELIDKGYSQTDALDFVLSPENVEQIERMGRWD